MEELTEVITAAEFHPIHCNQFVYSSSKGTIKLADMRDSALCDQHAKRECAPREGRAKGATGGSAAERGPDAAAASMRMSALPSARCRRPPVARSS
jgi:hypothetical protein